MHSVPVCCGGPVYLCALRDPCAVGDLCTRVLWGTCVLVCFEGPVYPCAVGDGGMV